MTSIIRLIRFAKPIEDTLVQDVENRITGIRDAIKRLNKIVKSKFEIGFDQQALKQIG